MNWMTKEPMEEGLYLVYDAVNGCVDDDIYEVSHGVDGWCYGVLHYEKKIPLKDIQGDGFLWYGPIPKHPTMKGEQNVHQDQKTRRN